MTYTKYSRPVETFSPPGLVKEQSLAEPERTTAGRMILKVVIGVLILAIFSGFLAWVFNPRVRIVLTGDGLILLMAVFGYVAYGLLDAFGQWVRQGN